MLIYRVEDSSGVGPYHSTDGTGLRSVLAERLGRAHSDDDHPGAFAEGFYRDPRFGARHVFAFASRADVASWFAGWADELDNAGYRVTVMRVDSAHVISGKRQVAVPAAEAQRIMSLSVRSLVP